MLPAMMKRFAQYAKPAGATRAAPRLECNVAPLTGGRGGQAAKA
jgi:hypothetical protein